MFESIQGDHVAYKQIKHHGILLLEVQGQESWGLFVQGQPGLQSETWHLTPL